MSNQVGSRIVFRSGARIRGHVWVSLNFVVLVLWRVVVFPKTYRGRFRVSGVGQQCRLRDFDPKIFRRPT